MLTLSKIKAIPALISNNYNFRRSHLSTLAVCGSQNVRKHVTDYNPDCTNLFFTDLFLREPSLFLLLLVIAILLAFYARGIPCFDSPNLFSLHFTRTPTRKLSAIRLREALRVPQKNVDKSCRPHLVWM